MGLVGVLCVLCLWCVWVGGCGVGVVGCGVVWGWPVCGLCVGRDDVWCVVGGWLGGWVVNV